MESFIVGGLWVLFVLLVIYVFISHRKNTDNQSCWTKIADMLSEVVRPIWYLAFILGCLIVITDDYYTLFEYWRNYLIALVSFVVIDALLFLNLYVSKIGNYELKSTKKQVGKTQVELDRATRKVRSLRETLQNFSYSGYNEDDDSYILGLTNVLQEYGKKEELDIILMPYNSEEEQEKVLSLVENELKLKTHLNKELSYIDPSDKMAFYPFVMENKKFVVRAKTTPDSSQIITAIDGDVINTLVIVYDNVLLDWSDEDDDPEREPK